MLARVRGMPSVCVGGWGGTSHGALVARSRRAARCARGPRGRGAARPYPRTPTRGKLSLQAFARCRARAALRAGCFCARARSDPPCARWWRAPSAPLALLAAPEGRGCAPLPPDPRPRQAELAGICALRARAALRAGVFLCWRMQRPACVRAAARVLRSAQVVLCSHMQRPAVLPAQFPGSRKSALLMTLPAARLTTSAGTFRRMSLPMASRPSRRRRMRFCRLMRSPSRSRSRRKMCPVT